MEKLTINRIGQVRNKSGVARDTGQPYNFNEVGFQTNEHPERWYDFTFNGQSHGLEEGKEYDFEIKTREYNGKTYYSARLPKRGGGGGMSDQDRALIKQAADNSYAANVTAQKCYTMLTDVIRNMTLSGVYKEHTSDGKPMPDFTATGSPPYETGDEPPLSAYENN